MHERDQVSHSLFSFTGDVIGKAFGWTSCHYPALGPGREVGRADWERRNMRSVVGSGFILQVPRFDLSATANPLVCLSAAPAFGEWSSCLEGECGWISGMRPGISMCFDALNVSQCPR